MADIRPKAASAVRMTWLAAVACSGMAVAAPAPDAAESETLPISVDAASSDVDYRRNTVVFRDVVISQGGTRVEADRAEATGLDFDNSTWSLRGDVRISLDGGQLSSDEATVEFRDNIISKATIVGRPAQFEQQLEAPGSLARGRARTIEYDMRQSTVRLAHEAWLSDGRNEISGEELVYSLREERVQAQARPGENDRVRITIRPQQRDGNDAATEGNGKAPGAADLATPEPPAGGGRSERR